MLSDKKFKVFVECMTYNQSQYIEEAMNGFVMQRTDFPFLCLIMDDASTDGEQEVIEAYLDKHFDMECAERSETPEANIVFATHKTNPNCTFVVYFLKCNLYNTNKKEPLIRRWRNLCEFVAICEGDDYWINEKKLQLQVTYLQANPNVSLSFHSVKYKSKEGVIYNDNVTEDVPGISSIRKLADGNYITTASVVLRNNPIIFEKKAQMGLTYVGDYVLWMLCALYGDIYKFPDIMAIYRTGTGVWSSGGDERIYQWVVMMSKLYAYMPDEIKLIFDRQIDAKIDKARTVFSEIYDSYSWRLGHMLLYPISVLKKLRKK